ncbi:MAG: endonuclease [Litorilituus sp.]|jgi:endonuclease I|nr:endonuclease [Litorilituus sp.]
MKKLSILACGLFSLNAVADVVITEYVEGGGYNKAIEITNLGTTNVELGAEGYTLSLYTNGSANPSKTSNLSGILVPNSSLVIYNNGLTVASSFEPPLGLPDNNVINHNGDDAYVLMKGDEVVDSFGQVGVDPGSYWGSSDNNSKDHTLRRLASVTTGDKDVSNTFDPSNSEWIFFDKDTVDGLGCMGEEACTGNEPAPLLEGDSTPVDTCIFTRCDEIVKVKLREDYVESTYYTKSNAAIDSDIIAFKQAVHEDIKVGHTQLTYNQVWTALIETDEDPDNPENIMLLYTGKSIAKAENASVNNNAPDSWNREHVWSKSHGFPNSSQLGYTDIHHLRPADASINSLRSNYDFDNGGEPAYDGSTVTENNLLSGISWEPRDIVKGDVARMMFYMAVRYEQSSDLNMPDLTLVDKVETEGSEFGKLCSLYDWHKNDPVDSQEIERNNNVYELQGNRNPFIDHPEWVEKIYSVQCEALEITMPTVSVGAIEVKEGEDVSLTANVNIDELTFEWSQHSGISLTLSATDSATVSFKAPNVDKAEVVVLSVSVTDNHGNQASTTVDITIADIPAALPEVTPSESSGGSIGYTLLALVSLLSWRTRAFKGKN